MSDRAGREENVRSNHLTEDSHVFVLSQNETKKANFSVPLSACQEETAVTS